MSLVEAFGEVVLEPGFGDFFEVFDFGFGDFASEGEGRARGEQEFFATEEFSFKFAHPFDQIRGREDGLGGRALCLFEVEHAFKAPAGDHGVCGVADGLSHAAFEFFDGDDEAAEDELGDEEEGDEGDGSLSGADEGGEEEADAEASGGAEEEGEEHAEKIASKTKERIGDS